MAVYGDIEAFDLQNGHFEEYLERLEQYFIANDIADEKKCAIFITVIGKEAYGVLRSLMSPDKPSSKSYTVVTKVFADHVNPKPIIIAERFKFYERKQSKNETVGEFIAAIRKLAICDFKNFLDEAIRDRYQVQTAENDC